MNTIEICDFEVSSLKHELSVIANTPEFKHLMQQKIHKRLTAEEMTVLQIIAVDIAKLKLQIERWTEIKCTEQKLLDSPLSIISKHHYPVSDLPPIHASEHQALLADLAVIMDSQYHLEKGNIVATFADILANGVQSKNPELKRDVFIGRPLYFRFTASQWSVLGMLERGDYASLPLGIEINRFLGKVMRDAKGQMF